MNAEDQPVGPAMDSDGEVEPRFARGDLVAWAGPSGLGDQLHLRPGHPGEVRSPQPQAMTVRWVDKQGWFNHAGIFLQEWLTPISQEEFDRREAELRQADWAGFPPGTY